MNNFVALEDQYQYTKASFSIVIFSFRIFKLLLKRVIF